MGRGFNVGKREPVFPGIEAISAGLVPSKEIGSNREPREKPIPESDTSLFPQLNVLLELRGLQFKPAFSREETLNILGISAKTLTRWIHQGRISDWGLPGICASADGIERCLTDLKSASRKNP